MCDVEKAQRIFDQWLIPVKKIEVVKQLDCAGGCENRYCSNPGDHPDHSLEVTIDIPICFSDCPSVSDCFCWYDLWADLGWFDTTAPTVAIDLQAHYLTELDIDITKGSLFCITYGSLVCPPNPLKGHSRFDLSI